jgi:hypothetical protein
MRLNGWSLIVGLVTSVGTIVLLNYRDLKIWRGSDMFAPHGVPFTLYREGGFGGGGGIVWTGAILDFFIALIGAAIIAYVLDWLLPNLRLWPTDGSK